MEENLNFVGWMKLSGNDENRRVFFDSEDEKDMIDHGFVYFITKTNSGETKYLLVNPNAGHIRYIEYEIDKNN